MKNNLLVICLFLVLVFLLVPVTGSRFATEEAFTVNNLIKINLGNAD